MIEWCSVPTTTRRAIEFSSSCRSARSPFRRGDQPPGRVEVADRFSFPVAMLVVGLVLAAYALSDLLSGIVHFLLDNFGSPETPMIGQKFVKPFRDHHVDPMEMTHGDFIAVNADNVFVCLPC